MQYSKMIAVSLLLLLTACGDDLSGLPDPETKAATAEPDAFSFETATLVDIGSRSYPARITSNVPANTTRYYQFVLSYFDVGPYAGDFKDVSLTDSSGFLELAWYNPSQELQNTHPTTLDMSGLRDLYYTDCCDEKFTFYISVANTSSIDATYTLLFGFIPLN